MGQMFISPRSIITGKDSGETNGGYNNNLLQHMGSVMSAGSQQTQRERSIGSTNHISKNLNHRKLL